MPVNKCHDKIYKKCICLKYKLYHYSHNLYINEYLKIKKKNKKIKKIKKKERKKEKNKKLISVINE